MTNTELAVIGTGDDSPYQLLRMEPADLQELVGDALAPGETLGMGDLKRIAWPGAGATTWEVPSSRGAQPVKELDGIILVAHTTRGWWRDSYAGQSGEDARPDCRSFDGVTGEGEPGGACLACPLNEWGTGEDEKGNKTEGKACKERRVLFVLPPKGVLPLVVSVPPASLRPLKQYRIALMDEGLNLQRVVSRLKLTAEEKQGVGKYAVLTIEMVGELDDDAFAAVRRFSTLVAPSMRRAAEDELRQDDSNPPPAATGAQEAGDLEDLA